MDKKTKARNIGIDVKAPKESCTDKKCPFHGTIKIRGRQFTGLLIGKDAHKTATVEWSYSVNVPKYERKETRRTRLHVHNPACINAEIGEIVRIAQTRPLSKTKNFVIIENLGKEKGFAARLEAEEEKTEVIKKSLKKKEEEDEIS
jgi:small subunit ribosomal protein S17